MKNYSLQEMVTNSKYIYVSFYSDNILYYFWSQIRSIKGHKNPETATECMYMSVCFENAQIIKEKERGKKNLIK